MVQKWQQCYAGSHTLYLVESRERGHTVCLGALTENPWVIRVYSGSIVTLGTQCAGVH